MPTDILPRPPERPESTVPGCLIFGAFKGMLVGVISWPLAYYGHWSVLTNFVFNGFVASAIVYGLAYNSKWPYCKYDFWHNLSDSFSFALVSTGIYWSFTKLHLYLNK